MTRLSDGTPAHEVFAAKFLLYGFAEHITADEIHCTRPKQLNSAFGIHRSAYANWVTPPTGASNGHGTCRGLPAIRALALYPLRH